MKKRFRIVALLLVACMTFMLAGCDLFPQNTAAYLNQIVITANYEDGIKIEISRKDYLTAYNNYGAELINSNGYTEEEAKEATINALVNRKILINEAKSIPAVVNKVNEEKQELYYQTYEALLSNANDYESAIRKDWNMEQADFGTSETKSGTVYTPYEKQAEVVYDGERDEYRIKKVEDNSTPVREKTFASLEEVKEAFYEATKNNNVDTFAKEEYRRYVASLKATQEVLKTKFTEDELVANEVERIYNNLEETEYLTKYQEHKQFNGGYSTITVSQVLNKYASMMSKSKFIYDNNADTYKEDVLGNIENVNYFVDDEYFYVAHILIKFSDEQQAEYDELKTLSNAGQGGIISAEARAEREQQLYSSIKGSVRDAETGEITNEDTISVNDILKEVEIALANAKTNEQKDLAFRELMYKYNEDDGIMNADYAYVVGEKESQMVENFTNASRELNNNGTYGAVSGLVQSEYGVHIIYYMGKCENLFEFQTDGTINLQANYTENDVPKSDILKLTTTYLNRLNNKTVFDMVYETLVEDNYSEFENVNLETLKHDKGIVVTTLKNI